VEEGKLVTALVNRYERKIENREACIRGNGTICIVCGFDFPSLYGAIGYAQNGKGYIHVHHLTKLASLEGKARRFDPVKDMAPVCPNCHEMLHQADPPYTPEQLRAIMAEARERASRLPARTSRA
jgi:5-methylcytosine-specific restriction protein A